MKKPLSFNEWCQMNTVQDRDYIIISAGQLLDDGTQEVFERRGFLVKDFRLDKPHLSEVCYNPFAYFRDDLDILQFVDVLLESTSCTSLLSTQECSYTGEQSLLAAIIALLLHYHPKDEQTLSKIQYIIRMGYLDENNSYAQSNLDLIFEDLRAKHPDCFAITQYDAFKLGSIKTQKNILLSCAVRLRSFDLEYVWALTNTDTLMQLSSRFPNAINKGQIIWIQVDPMNTMLNFLVSLLIWQSTKERQATSDKTEPLLVIFENSHLQSMLLPDTLKDKQRDTIFVCF